MSEALTSIPTIGPATEKLLLAAGITTGEMLRELGAHEAYRRVLLAGARPNFLWYFVLAMALQGRPWNDAVGNEKKALRKEFNDLVRETQKLSGAAGAAMLTRGMTPIDAQLDAIGVRYQPQSPASA